eukprot:6119252-Prymnesium_polylepis.1
MANATLTEGRNMITTPDTRPTEHSSSCRARSPTWQATSVAEHAVSYAAHGPCIPRAYEIRPHATAVAEP